MEKRIYFLPYQALNDSVDVVNLNYNAGTSAFDTTSHTKYENPKRWGI